jgi:hypothetical protein
MLIIEEKTIRISTFKLNPEIQHGPKILLCYNLQATLFIINAAYVQREHISKCNRNSYG